MSELITTHCIECSDEILLEKPDEQLLTMDDFLNTPALPNVGVELAGVSELSRGWYGGLLNI